MFCLLGYYLKISIFVLLIKLFKYLKTYRITKCLCNWKLSICSFSGR